MTLHTFMLLLFLFATVIMPVVAAICVCRWSRVDRNPFRPRLSTLDARLNFLPHSKAASSAAETSNVVSLGLVMDRARDRKSAPGFLSHLFP
jgi:hypothetical protein